MESEEYYRVGRVRRAHGIRGELVVELLTDEPDAIFASGRRVLAGDRHGDLATGEGAQELRVLRATPFNTRAFGRDSINSLRKTSRAFPPRF